ncbi:DUF3617 domain-containing protein [Mangrovimicrobium sediminis]|nr:DUF3617 family protein [Haliea sp. SAOS-164]
MTARRYFRTTLGFLALGGCLLAAPSRAESFDVEPRPGLWKASSKILINGQDFMEQMRAARQQMLERLPPEAHASIPEAPSEEQLSCVTAEKAKSMSDVDTWLQELSGDGGCTFSKTGETSNSVKFAGSCDGSSGYAGEMSGELVADGPTGYTMKMEGSGMMSGPGGMQQEMTQQIMVTGSWVDGDCGDVVPE